MTEEVEAEAEEKYHWVVMFWEGRGNRLYSYTNRTSDYMAGVVVEGHMAKQLKKGKTPQLPHRMWILIEDELCPLDICLDEGLVTGFQVNLPPSVKPPQK